MADFVHNERVQTLPHELVELRWVGALRFERSAAELKAGLYLARLSTQQR